MRFKESALVILAAVGLILSNLGCATPMYDPDRMLFQDKRTYDQSNEHFHSTSPLISPRSSETNYQEKPSK